MDFGCEEVGWGGMKSGTRGTTSTKCSYHEDLGCVEEVNGYQENHEYLSCVEEGGGG